MSVSISVVLLLVILAVIFLRNGSLKMSHALVCILLGFYLAGTAMAPSIQTGLNATTEMVSGIRP
ncbi:hypothetical protein ACFQLX_24910 [Streptomyces polyrhachis]|uniref:Uncharacterized protein n=1 Tax=Streptomyces polyrhachis TaxID=1282885 RepID=A0ABW2GKW5_9ACTN